MGSEMCIRDRSWRRSYIITPSETVSRVYLNMSHAAHNRSRHRGRVFPSIDVQTHNQETIHNNVPSLSIGGDCGCRGWYDNPQSVLRPLLRRGPLHNPGVCKVSVCECCTALSRDRCVMCIESLVLYIYSAQIWLFCLSRCRHSAQHAQQLRSSPGPACQSQQGHSSPWCIQ